MDINNTKTEGKNLPNVGNSVFIRKAIRSSGLLAYLSPEDFQTLVALLTFTDGSGRCELSARILGQSLNLSENQARRRLNSLCSVQWQGKPLVRKDTGRECGKFVSSAYQVEEVDGMRLFAEGRTPLGKCKASVPDNGHTENGKPGHDGSMVDDPRAGDRAKEAPISDTPAASVQDAGDDVSVVNINNINKDNTGTQEGILDVKGRIRRALIKVGVSESIGDELIGSYPADRLIRQLHLLPFRNAKEPAAMLVKAIREDWSAPSAYVLREKEKAKEKEKSDAEARYEQERRLWQEKVEAAKARLSQQELEDVRKAARDRVIKQLGHVLHGEAPETLVNSEVNRIIAKKYLNNEK